MIHLTQTLTQMKQSYIEYALFHYHFKSRISVWILNYIKSHTELLEHVHFVNQRIFNHKTLELALTNTDAPRIRLVKNNHLLINTNEIFEYVTTHQNDFDILIHFSDQHTIDFRFNDLIIHQLMYSPQYMAYLNTIYNLSLDSTRVHSLVEHLRHNIDLSLQLNDRELFYQLTQILEVLENR